MINKEVVESGIKWFKKEDEWRIMVRAGGDRCLWESTDIRWIPKAG